MIRIFARVMLGFLRAYKWVLSPLLLPACRYVPTCSEYAMEAIEEYGALRGSLMAMERLLRCHPLARGGYDPAIRRPISNSAAGSTPAAAPCNH